MLRSHLVCVLGVLVSLCLSGAGASAKAADVRVAVAANFASTLRELVALFEADTGHDVEVSAGATGLLFAQIARGAPFDLFLAADTERPAALINSGRAVSGSERIYALGQLALWAPGVRESTAADAVRANPGAILALPNPALAPYGLAAEAWLSTHELLEVSRDRWALAQNVAGSFAYVYTGQAAAGFVALSQLMEEGVPPSDYWLLDPADYPAIAQGLVLTQRAADNQAARALLTFLVSDKARAVIAQAGYGLVSPGGE